jgi:glycosyltransferase involved in cell wall biosynthesis
LDAALRARGLETMMLVDDSSGHQVTRFLHEQLWDASVRFRGTPLLEPSTRWLRSIPGRRTREIHTERGDLQVTHAPENAFPDLALTFQPDLVVASSISRPSWRAIRETCAVLGVPTALYLREETALRHLEPNNGHHDLVLGNSRTLVDGAAVHGVRAHFVPSVVDLSSARCQTSRNSVLLVNPKESHGVGRIADLARTFPTVPFVLQESWDLDAKERTFIGDLLAHHPNVSFRSRRSAPSEIFRDVGLLLAPHRIDNRPRTVLEAQVNGIPVIATAQPGLIEAVGPGGVCIPLEAGPSAWRDAVSSIWSNPSRYAELESAARAHADRPEVEPDHVVNTFIRLAQSVEGTVQL